MPLKRPKQGQSPADYKLKEMLVLSALSPDAAKKFTGAIRKAAGKV
jgi:hypothetical protein